LQNEFQFLIGFLHFFSIIEQKDIFIPCLKEENKDSTNFAPRTESLAYIFFNPSSSKHQQARALSTINKFWITLANLRASRMNSLVVRKFLDDKPLSINSFL